MIKQEEWGFPNGGSEMASARFFVAPASFLSGMVIVQWRMVRMLRSPVFIPPAPNMWRVGVLRPRIAHSHPSAFSNIQSSPVRGLGRNS